MAEAKNMDAEDFEEQFAKLNIKTEPQEEWPCDNASKGCTYKHVDTFLAKKHSVWMCDKLKTGFECCWKHNLNTSRFDHKCLKHKMNTPTKVGKFHEIEFKNLRCDRQITELFYFDSVVFSFKFILRKEVASLTLVAFMEDHGSKYYDCSYIIKVPKVQGDTSHFRTRVSGLTVKGLLTPMTEEDLKWTVGEYWHVCDWRKVFFTAHTDFDPMYKSEKHSSYWTYDVKLIIQPKED